MARLEKDREDLIRDAKSYINRIEISIQNNSHVVFLGIKNNHAGSIYFDQDPVFQFNSAGELRRAYAFDGMIKAVSGELVLMRRVRGGGKVELRSRTMEDEQLAAFLQLYQEKISQLLESIESKTCEVLREVLEPDTDHQVIFDWLKNIGTQDLVIAQSPNAV